ncbi:hypothetical protein OQA88_11920 [Cercophora sp. LCS_1]
MAARLPSFLQRHVARQMQPTSSGRTISRFSRAYSTPAPPPLLAKLKGDLKTAMKAKDAPRLAVVRAILTATLNASKTATPIQTDVQVVNLIRKQIRTAEESVAQFREASRQDLIDKEEAQIHIMNEYLAGSNVESLEEAGLRQIAEQVVECLASEGKVSLGDVMKKLMGPGSPLDGKEYNKGDLNKIVKDLVAGRQG